MTVFLLGSTVSYAADTGLPELERLLTESSAAYENLKDYTAIFTKEEEGTTEKIYLKFERPFKIYMQWLEPPKKGLEVIYERDRHDNKIGVHLPGLLFKLKPVIFLPQDSPWIGEGSGSSFNIEDAGIGTFLFDFKKAVEEGERQKKIEVRLQAPLAAGRFVDVSFPGTQKKSPFFAGRVIVFFDAATKLPTVMKLFDWEGKVIGTYRYDDLKLNVGPDDSA
ncbi:MAG: DUF1571 domain-containing protein, partial [Candidatus Omnitrophica bacterium]|nr:DUF1571 domain-containing protein [Candidatus Omnitrophota bacterium]